MTEKLSEKAALLPEQPPPPYYQVDFRPPIQDERNCQGQDHIREVPLPPLQAGGERERDKKMVISVVFIGISLFLTGLWAGLCLIPSLYCLYQAKNERDPYRKDKLMNKVIVSSGIVMIISIVWGLFSFAVLIFAIVLAGIGSQE